MTLAGRGTFLIKIALQIAFKYSVDRLGSLTGQTFTRAGNKFAHFSSRKRHNRQYKTTRDCLISR